LPTPANALFIVFLPFLFENKFLISYSNFLDNVYFLLFITVLFSYLLVCNLKMFSFKFKNFSFQENKLRLLFSILSMLIIVFFNIGSLPIIITLYIFISLLRIKF
jgi:CDP-diacylglycerol--serine O-phosphatidyltransferase